MLLYCKNFQFNNGNLPKDKYFIVLKRDKNHLIIGSLPTRTNKIPSFIDIEHGCINKDDRCFNCYLFKEKRVICDNGFYFDLPTFIYGDEIETYDGLIIDANYILNQSYTIEGKLTSEEFTNLINCILKSSSVKKRIQKALS